jgi:hypothetical protein
MTPVENRGEGRRRQSLPLRMDYTAMEEMEEKRTIYLYMHVRFSP